MRASLFLLPLLLVLLLLINDDNDHDDNHYNADQHGGLTVSLSRSFLSLLVYFFPWECFFSFFNLLLDAGIFTSLVLCFLLIN